MFGVKYKGFIIVFTTNKVTIGSKNFNDKKLKNRFELNDFNTVLNYIE